MPSNEKVNCKQHDKAGRRVSGPVSDLAFRDVSISLLAHCVQLSPLLSVVKDTRPIRAYRISWVEATLGRWYNKDEKEEYWGVRHIRLETMLSLVKWGKKDQNCDPELLWKSVCVFMCAQGKQWGGLCAYSGCSQYVHVQVFQMHFFVVCHRAILSPCVCFYLFYFLFQFECAPLQTHSLTSFHELLALKWKLITQEYSLKGCL